MLKITEKKEQGFTLIELMIVVAIIGILAAIAIPQFSSYRIKAFNSAAEADLRNLMTSQEATYADSQAYAANATSGTGPAVISTLTGAKVSKGVTYSVNTFSSDSAYTIYTGHSKGDKSYGGDQTGLMRYKDETAGNVSVTTYTSALTSTWGNGQL